MNMIKEYKKSKRTLQINRAIHILLKNTENRLKNKNVYFPSPVIHTIIDLTVTFKY